jgi:hypothetical protein
MEIGSVVAENSSCSPKKRYNKRIFVHPMLQCILFLKANWTTAKDQCCSIGLSLAVIPTMGKKMCMDKMINS